MARSAAAVGLCAWLLVGCGPVDVKGPSVASDAGAVMSVVKDGPPAADVPVWPVPPDAAGGCGLRTCTSAHANCGLIGDGCNGTVDCGKCQAPEICGGGGMPSVCGGRNGCTPRTCSQAGASCGPAADGCGGVLDCGPCTAPQTCGGSGTPSACGMPNGHSCVPTTCAQAGANCGPVADGCGGKLDCGSCTAPQTCGGGGTPSVCGAIACVPRTCAQAGANCGPIADGCGGLVQCGTCTAPDICGGGGVPNVCGDSRPDGGTCTNLCTQRPHCDGGTTTITGIVHAPTPPQFGAADPLYDALVYIPNAPVQPFPQGVSCDQCGAEASGSPLVSAVTAPDGSFTLLDVPAGANIPLVIQLGRWRRQVVIPNVAACRNTALSPELTRLPRNKREGDIPKMAMVTGSADSIECVLRKIGIDDTEFTDSHGNGRIQFFMANGANAGLGTLPDSALWNNPATLHQYDMVLFACEGSQVDKPASAQTNIIDYTNAGGRIFATHYSYTWLFNDAPFSTTANWNIDQPFPFDPLIGTVDQSFPKGKALSQWLSIVGAASSPGQISIGSPRHDLDTVNAPSQRWIYSTNPASTQHYTFNTPIGAQPAQQCGRVLYSDFHVNEPGFGISDTFPEECKIQPLTPQEKVLEYMLFDLASCITPDQPIPPMCTPRNCAQVGASCGKAGDGCGGMLDCGTCTPPDTCGGGGTPSQCGHKPCTTRTCADQALHCGPAGDGCGGSLDCGSCTPPDTCGGAGMPGVCGHLMSCQPVTCAQLGYNCGPAGDGCGGRLDCGTCTPPQTCGGGGVPGVCGGDGCVPRTCAQMNANCGPVADGCGGVVDCGKCAPPEACGGGGTPNQCGMIG